MNLFAPPLDQFSATGTAHGPDNGVRGSFVDRLSTAIFLLSSAGQVLDCNRSALAIADCSRDEILGKLFCEALLASAPDSSSRMAEALALAQVSESSTLDLDLDPASEGTAGRTLRITFSSLSAEDGQPSSFLAEARDVTAEMLRVRELTQLLKSAERERNRLHDVISQAPAAVGFTSGPDHRWTFVNDDYVRLSGRFSQSDFLGKMVREGIPEVVSQGFPAVLDKVYRDGKPHIGREVKATINRTARGLPEEGYFDFLYHPMRNENGEVEGIFIYAVEVTDMVNARRAIEQNAERLRLAQSAAQIGVWEWDPTRNFSMLSPELHRIFGTDASDPDHAAKWAARVYPDDRAKVQMLMMEGHRLGSMEFEYRYIHPDLGKRWLYCKGQCGPSETGMFGVVQDVTVRKSGDVAAHRLAAIVESSDDAIVSKDLNGIVASWNPGAERIFGFTAEEMIGQPITKIIPPEYYEDETRILSTIARGERIDHFETVRLHKNGSELEISLTISPVKDESGRIIGAAKIARDITQQKKAERALRTSERLASVGRLAATVAHEINNPLEAVTNLIYLAKSSDNPKKYLEMAEEELERVSHLTRQTLGFYRETKAASRVRVGELVESLLVVFAARMRNKNVQLHPDINQEVEIQAVPGEIRQVIANLVSNSIDALAPDGRIWIRVSPAVLRREEPVPGVRVSIADTGTGIPAEIRNHLFEPFFTTKKDVGTGLGLWICKSIVENHNGSIRVHSLTTPGHSGTVFSIFLPSVPALKAQSASLLPVL